MSSPLSAPSCKKSRARFRLRPVSSCNGLQADGQRKQRSAQRMSEDLQSDVEFDRQNILTAASARMRQVISDLRVAQGVDLIVEGSGVLAADPLIDLTAEATQAYDAKHPAN